MKKKLLALLCVLSVLVGVFAASATMAAAAEETFQVGYAKVDINPYVTDGDPNSGIMSVPLRGTGTSYERLATGKMDDNGDGVVDENDGLFATCIAISDSEDNTVLLITMDAIGDMGHSKLARAEICSRIPGMTPDRIMISGTHAHGGVDLEANTSKLSDEVKTNLTTWKNRLIDHLADAAELAMANRAPATVQKGEIEATDQSAAATGSHKVMNSMRNYYVEDQKLLGLYTNKYVISDVYYPRAEDSDYKNSVSEVDQTLHVISFNFENGNQPIVLANWRCHPSLNSNGDNDKKVTSDYVNAFRYQLEQAGYRPAFFQGAGGNSNPADKVDGAGSWITNGNVYGAALAQIAMYALNESNGFITSVNAGEIKTIQKVYKAKSIVYSAEEIAAAEAATSNTDWPYTYNGVTLASATQRDRIIKYKNHTESSTTTMEINALLIGPNIAIVTTPGEAFDRYSSQVTWQDIADKNWTKINSYNDWDNLIEENAYGTPLIFGYANLHVTYIPNSLAYEYNATEIGNGTDDFGRGSYETHMTPLAQGAGEEMVAKLDQMLEYLMADSEGFCAACNKVADWIPMDEDHLSNLGNTTGHYYLTSDVEVPQKDIAAGVTLCLDLNGYSITSTNNRVFNAKASDGAKHAVLNIMDSSEQKTGKVIGLGAGSSGGTLYTNDGSTINIYGGEISCTGAGAFGGVVYIDKNSTVNVYDGKIVGGHANRFGGAVCVAEATSKLNVYGGEITAGTAGGYSTKDAAKGVCVAFRNGIGQVSVGGNAKVAEIAYIVNQSSVAVSVQPTEATFKIVDTPVDVEEYTPFTGSVTLNACGMTHGAFVGSVSVPFGKGATVATTGGYDIELNENNQLVAEEGVSGAAGVVLDEEITSYNTLAEAIANVGEGYVILGADVENLTISKNITIDLNGRNINNVTVASGVTLSLKDNKTDDFFVGDCYYGVVKNVSGKVVAAKNYLAIVEEDGTSYHGYEMKMDKVTLRPGRVGMYYTAGFDGDAMVVSQINSFGTALRIGQAPNANSMQPGQYTAFTPEEYGVVQAKSTVLVDIMQATNVFATNKQNAETEIYGSAYIKLKDGRYLFSDAEHYSLKTLAEEVSKSYSVDVLKENADLMELYRKYSAVMSDWDIQNIKDAYAAHQKAEDEILKVIILGSSYSIDSYHLLGEVINAEGIPESARYNGTPIKGVEVAIMYKSGCYMYQHASYAKNNTAAYTYYKTSYRTDSAYTSGWSERKATTLEYALNDEEWDIVVLQESNMAEGIAKDSHTTDTQYVVSYVKRTLGYTPKFMWNMTWSNPEVPNCDGTAGENEWIYEIANPGAESWERRMNEYFNNDGQTQHNKMVHYVKKYIAGNYGISNDNIVTPGTAVMYALNNLTLSGSTYDYLSNEKFMYRDYTHLSDKGRVMVSYLWYAELFGLDRIDQMNYTQIPYEMQQVKTSNKTPLSISVNEQALLLDAVNATLADRFCAYTGE